MRETLRGIFGRFWAIVGTPVGYLLVIAGLVLLLLPGPGLLVLALGLGILAEREHAWAKHYHGKMKGMTARLKAWAEQFKRG